MRRPLGGAVLAMTVTLVASACSGDDSAPDAASDAPSAEPTAVALSLDLVAEMEWPTAMSQRPGTDLLYVTQQAGPVRVIDRATGELDPEPALDLTDVVDIEDTGMEPGLLGIAFHPEEPLVYLSFTSPLFNEAGEPTGWDRVIAEYSVAEDGVTIDPASRRDVLVVDKEAMNHNGGAIEFGPDGYLYGGFGDDSPSNDQKEMGQDPSTLLASLWRIDPLGDAPGEYSVPDDNPFADGITDAGDPAAPEVWLYGVRNPWRFAFDPATDDLWLPDVGNLQVEEVNHLPAAEGAGRGANLGWSLFEGSEPTDRLEGPVPADYHAPIHDYRIDDSDGCAIIGGKVYRGDAVPALDGAFLFGDYCSRELQLVWVDADGELLDVTHAEVDLPNNMISAGQDDEGEIYLLLTLGVYRLAER